MRRRPFLLAPAVLLTGVVHARAAARQATTEDGRRVVLDDDGTWSYADADAPAAAARITLSELAAQPRRFIDRPVRVRARVRTESHFLDGYADAARTHQPFALQDIAAPYAVCIVYMERGAHADALRRRIPSEGAIEGDFTLRILPRRYTPDAAVLLAELVDYEV